MTRFLLIFSAVLFILAGCLLLTEALAHARPKAPPRAPTMAQLVDQLTPEEIACRAGGILVQAIVVDRDNLVPLTTTIAQLRLLLATSSAVYERDMVEIAQLLYQRPTWTGAGARQAFEVGCLGVK